MRVSFVVAWLFWILFVIVAGVTPALAQSLPAPTPVRPLTSGIPNVPGSDALSAGDGAFVYFTHVNGATHYKICLRVPNTGACFNGNALVPVTARMQGPPLSQGLPIGFFVPGLETREGQSILWEVRACTGPSSAQCGAASTTQTVIVLLPIATIPADVSQIIPSNQTVTFQWTNHPLADAPPQLIVLPDWTNTRLQPIFTSTNPTTAGAPGLSIQMGQGATSHTITLANDFKPALKWAVANCRNYGDKGRRCSQLFTRWQKMRVANMFPYYLAFTFNEARCMNCHAAAATNFQIGAFPGLPASHPQVNATTNNQSTQNGQGCRSCHTDALLPTQGSINPGWHAPPASMDFRNRSITQLCQMAKSLGSSKAAYNHLTKDKLILWAVVDGRVPNGSTLPLAAPGSLEEWRHAVALWLESGMSC